jgi:hypothetical protein
MTDVHYDSTQLFSSVIQFTFYRITARSEPTSQTITMSHQDALRLAADVNQKLTSRTQPLTNPMQLPSGHTEVLQRADDIDIEPIRDSSPSVRLNALLALHPALSDPETPAATTLAIRMDQSVAMRLAGRIFRLAQTMGWPTPTEGESQA